MVDGEEKSQEIGNQTEKEKREFDKHVKANPQKFDNRMSDTSNALTLFFPCAWWSPPS